MSHPSSALRTLNKNTPLGSHFDVAFFFSSFFSRLILLASAYSPIDVPAFVSACVVARRPDKNCPASRSAQSGAPGIFTSGNVSDSLPGLVPADVREPPSTSCSTGSDSLNSAFSSSSGLRGGLIVKLILCLSTRRGDMMDDAFENDGDPLDASSTFTSSSPVRI